MLNNMTKYITITITLLFLSACQTDFPVNKIPDSFELSVYGKGNYTKYGAVKASNEMLEFFEKEKFGWEKVYVTFAPYYLLSSKDMIINIGKNIVVVNYSNEKNKFVQYCKNVNTQELISIIEENKSQDSNSIDSFKYTLF